MVRMVRSTQSALVLASTLLASAALVGQQPPPATTSASAQATTTRSASSTISISSSNSDRTISSNLAETLAASRPKYEPPKPVEKKPEEEEETDLRDTDKPKNHIVRLPKFVVSQAKPAIFRERDINTKKGLMDIAMKRYGGPGVTPSLALQLYQQGQRARNINPIYRGAPDA